MTGNQPIKGSLIRIWDLPVRLGHWTLVLSFVTAWLSSEGERWKMVHITAGAVAFMVVAFRIYWGFFGTRYARFNNFLHHPGAALQYLSSLARKKPIHFLGHNPAGGYAIASMLGLILISCVSGYLAYNEIADTYTEKIHDYASNALLILVMIHLAAVLISSLLHRENLVTAMLSGKKIGQQNESISTNAPLASLLLLALVLAGFFLARQL